MFYVSAGVYSKEKDLSEIVPAVAATSAALVGYSPKGSTDRIRTITSNQQFIREYGTPVPGNWFHYTALAYLSAGNKLSCLRVVNNNLDSGLPTALYGGCSIAYGAGTAAGFGTGRVTKSFQTASTGDPALFDVFAKDPGAWNNGLSVAVTFTTTGINPDSDEKNFTITVSQTDAAGTTTEVERFHVSRQTKLDGYGAQMYLESAINGISKYIEVYDNVSVPDTTMPNATVTVEDEVVTVVPVDFTGGDDGEDVTAADILRGWGQFANPDVVDFRIAIHGGTPGAGSNPSDVAAVHVALQGLCESRRDCWAILDPPSGTPISTPDNTVEFRGTQHINSSYTSLYAPWIRVFDQYSGQVISVPPSGYVAARVAFSDKVANPWDAPAGLNRGVMPNVLGFTYTYSQGDRDLLYASPNNINPLQTFMGQGNVVWGQKTQQFKASALDRVNTRRTLIVVEKALSAALLPFVFENNSPSTRLRIKAMVEAYLSTLNAGGAFQTVNGEPGYKVVCDESNNPPEVVDQHQLSVDVYVKPAQTAEFIQLQTIVTTSGASFNELIAQNS